MKPGFDAMMDRCVRLGREAAGNGNYGLGALVAGEEEIIAESGSSLIQGHDPTGHPEIQAIRLAAERLGSRYLPGTYLFTTLEPCPMCTSAAIWAKMRGIVYGASQADAATWSSRHPHSTYTWRQIRLPAKDVVRAGDPRLEIHGGVRRDACLELFPLTEGSLPARTR